MTPERVSLLLLAATVLLVPATFAGGIVYGEVTRSTVEYTVAAAAPPAPASVPGSSYVFVPIVFGISPLVQALRRKSEKKDPDLDNKVRAIIETEFAGRR